MFFREPFRKFVEFKYIFLTYSLHIPTEIMIFKKTHFIVYVIHINRLCRFQKCIYCDLPKGHQRSNIGENCQIGVIWGRLVEIYPKYISFVRDNSAEPRVFRKRLNIKETIVGS